MMICHDWPIQASGRKNVLAQQAKQLAQMCSADIKELPCFLINLMPGELALIFLQNF